MDVQTILVTEIVVGERQRQADAKKVGELAQSIEQVGLLQPIGVVDECSLEQPRYRLVFGLHRVHAMVLLERAEIAAYVLPPDLEPEEYLLMELQENSARNDLSGAQRKAFAAEIGRLLSHLEKTSHLLTENLEWFTQLRIKAGVTQPTLYRWWQEFCAATDLTLTPRQALSIHRERFFVWLEDQQRQAEAERQRKAQDAAEAERLQYLTDLHQEITEAIARYGWASVYELVILPIVKAEKNYV